MYWLLFVLACEETELAKSYSGTLIIDLPCEQKLFDMDWNNDAVWYATKKFNAFDVPETYTYVARAEFEMLNATVMFKESFCKRSGFRAPYQNLVPRPTLE